MRTIFTNHRRAGMFFVTVGLIMAFSIIFSARGARANGDWDDNDGTDTLCKDWSARLTLVPSSNDQISMWEKVKVGTNVVLVFNSSVDNSLSFNGGRAKLTTIQAPPNCKFKNVVANTNADCLLASTDTSDPSNNGVKVNFNCTTGPQSFNLGDPAITPANQNANIFNAANAVLGLGIDLSACNVTDTDDQKKACAAAICNGIKDQLTNGNTKSLSTAADLGSLLGSMQTTLDRCFARSSVFKIVGNTSCKPDDIAASTALALLLGAPEEHVQIDSSGPGVYQASILAGSTLFTPGDFANIDMNTCVANFLQQ